MIWNRCATNYCDIRWTAVKIRQQKLGFFRSKHLCPRDSCNFVARYCNRAVEMSTPRYQLFHWCKIYWQYKALSRFVIVGWRGIVLVKFIRTLLERCKENWFHERDMTSTKTRYLWIWSRTCKLFPSSTAFITPSRRCRTCNILGDEERQTFKMKYEHSSSLCTDEGREF